MVDKYNVMVFIKNEMDRYVAILKQCGFDGSKIDFDTVTESVFKFSPVFEDPIKYIWLRAGDQEGSAVARYQQMMEYNDIGISIVIEISGHIQYKTLSFEMCKICSCGREDIEVDNIIDYDKFKLQTNDSLESAELKAFQFKKLKIMGSWKPLGFYETALENHVSRNLL